MFPLKKSEISFDLEDRVCEDYDKKLINSINLFLYSSINQVNCTDLGSLSCNKNAIDAATIILDKIWNLYHKK